MFFLYFAKDKLPWQGVKTKNKREKHKKIMEYKEEYTPDKLCEGLPEEFPSKESGSNEESGESSK